MRRQDPAHCKGIDDLATEHPPHGLGQWIPLHRHVGFFVGKPELVHAKRAELAEAGFAPGEVQDLTRGGFNSTTFYCIAPGGILVEISSSPT